MRYVKIDLLRGVLSVHATGVVLHLLRSCSLRRKCGVVGHFSVWILSVITEQAAVHRPHAIYCAWPAVIRKLPS